jgi:uncharacterized protein (TIGR03083 family)
VRAAIAVGRSTLCFGVATLPWMCSHEFSDPMRPPNRVDVLHLFNEERAELLGLLRGLTREHWALPTVCPGWSVRDIALHLLGDDLGRLSRTRDHFRGQTEPGADESIVDLVNRLNELWVAATRRLSPGVLCDLLSVSGEWTLAYFVTLDLDTVGGPVSWAGPEPAPVWLDIAREYTERWHHQQQIRDAVAAPELTARRLFAPVLATFAHALPHTFRDTDAMDGSSVHLHIAGEAGGDWSIRRESAQWHLYVGAPDRANARVTIDQSLAWRLFTRGLVPAEAEESATIEGDRELGRQILRTVAVIA